MKTLYKMLYKSFFPIFLISLLFFILTLEMVDLFANLLRFLNNDAAVTDILTVSLYYIPKSATYALPPALLFSIAFTLGNLYSRNELISILGAGVSFRTLIVPLILIGILCSAGYYLFYEHAVIDTYIVKNQLSQKLLGQKVSYSNTDITVLGAENKNVYHADYYNDASKTLSGLTVVKRDERGNFIGRLEAEWAEFNPENGWIMYNVSVFEHGPPGETDGTYFSEVQNSFRSELTDDTMRVMPINFQRKTKNIDELKYSEARDWILTLKKSGRVGYRSALTDYYKRFSFAFTPFIVVLLSASLGSRFRKNILLMSLLISLIISVVYYVSDMILGLFAKQGIIGPATGAWGPVLLFSVLGAVMLKFAKT